jgi:hypothetical protein
MSLTEAIIEGTLNPDGSLVLDRKPNLPPGRVTVRVQLLTALPEGDAFFDMLKGIWSVRARAGLTPRSAEEIEAQRRQLREDSGREIAEAATFQAESRRSSEQAERLTGGRE